jgi:drug/metabolite transporter (DMT)-like permease
VLVAFAAVYLVWGSTYLAIRVGIETIPPLLMASVRFLVAGALLYGVSRLRGAPRPTRGNWRATAIVGALLLLGGNGGVVLAERTVPSGVAALLVATVPVWMVVQDWLWRGAARPGLQVVSGLVLGIAGLGLLVGPGALGGGAIDGKGAAILVAGSLCWATGSIYSREADLPHNAMLGTGMEMLAGGGLLGVAGALLGEVGMVHPSAISGASLLGLLYLVTFGSLVGFTAYIWLLDRVPAPRVATYAYVNPIVAVLLGWAVLGEALTPRMGAAAAVIVAGVVLITTAGSRRKPPRRSLEPVAEEAA